MASPDVFTRRRGTCSVASPQKGAGRRGEVEALLALDASRGWTLHLREAKEDKQKFHRRRCRECPL